MSSWFQRPKHDWLSSTRTRSDSVTVVVVKRVWAPDASRSSIGQVLTQQPDIFRLGNGVRRRGRKNRLVRRKKIGKTRHCVYLYTHTHTQIYMARSKWWPETKEKVKRVSHADVRPRDNRATLLSPARCSRKVSPREKCETCHRHIGLHSIQTTHTDRIVRPFKLCRLYPGCNHSYFLPLFAMSYNSYSFVGGSSGG